MIELTNFEDDESLTMRVASRAFSPKHRLLRASTLPRDHQPADRKFPIMAENSLFRKKDSLFRAEQGIAHSALELRCK